MLDNSPRPAARRLQPSVPWPKWEAGETVLQGPLPNSIPYAQLRRYLAMQEFQLNV